MRLPPEEIYRYALEAGFSPDQAVTMTAIALAESGGNPEAHNPVGEDSIGLWQVNRQAHPRFAGLDGTDPLTNARMAYEVSGGGADIGRWTVTHADKGARYLQYRAQAEAAAAANGYPDAVGQWDPPENYYSPKVSAGPATTEAPEAPVTTEVAAPPEPAAPPEVGLDPDQDGLVTQYEQAIGTDPEAADSDRDGFSDSVEVLHHTDPLDFTDNPLVASSGDPAAYRPPLTTAVEPAPEVAVMTATSGAGSGIATPTAPPAPAEGGPLDVFLDAALSQDGAPYIFGAEVDLATADPQSSGAAFDCSELVEWAAAQAGVDVPDGSYNQYLHLRDAGAELTVAEALQTPGALVFNFSSEPVPGGGRPASAHVAISLGNGQLIEARGRSYGVGQFDSAGREFSHAAFIPELGTELTPSLTGLEGEVLADPLPVIWDGDGDGLLNAYEQLISIDPFSPDTDRDGFLDGLELTYGTDPLDFADNPLVVPAAAGAAHRPPLTTELPASTGESPGVGSEALVPADEPLAEEGDDLRISLGWDLDDPGALSDADVDELEDDYDDFGAHDAGGDADDDDIDADP